MILYFYNIIVKKLQNLCITFIFAPNNRGVYSKKGFYTVDNKIFIDGSPFQDNVVARPLFDAHLATLFNFKG